MTPRASYAPSRGPSKDPGGGVVASVDPDSAGQRAGIAAGSRVTAADGQRLRDVIDWRWHADGPSVDVEWTDACGIPHIASLERDPGQAWGIEFVDPVFDGIRTCRNRCPFCFVAQLPRGLRPALYVRDDDYRLSFLQGNFVTLTNLVDEDVSRILEQRLSPLYVSVHAIDPEVRARIVCAREDRALERLEELDAAGIALHAQVVLVPGVNDGEVLDRTLAWLAQRDAVESVGVVPVGYTRFQDSYSPSYNSAAAARAVVAQLASWRERRRHDTGRSWVHAADELHLNARLPLPPATEYDGFPQYENGIGLVRAFMDDVVLGQSALKQAITALRDSGGSVAVVTGTLAATTLADALDACGASGRVRVLAVPNRFFGGNVSVAGLLTGEDLITALGRDRRDASECVYLLPYVMLNPDGLTLDDLSLDDIRSASGADARLVSSDAAGLLAGIVSAVNDPTSP